MSIWLCHYGVSKLDGAPGRGSGRYPLGSGEEPYHHYSLKEKASAIKGKMSDKVKSIKERIKKKINEMPQYEEEEEEEEEIENDSYAESIRRGRAALDVLMNGDRDWMDNPISSSDVNEEARNRAKAALERLMYSEEQIENKKFFGEYNPFD